MSLGKTAKWSQMKLALKIGVPLVVVAVVAIVVIGVVAGGGKQKPQSATSPPDQARAVSKQQIEQLPTASQQIVVTNRFGRPERVEEPGLASENPQRVYLYYPVKGAESELWELAFERGANRLTDTTRCPVAVVVERGGDCSKPPPRPV